MALFREAYADLSRTAEDLPPFEDLVTQLPRSMRKTMVLEMNARHGDTPVPEWKDHYAHILVGGQALDRGFTVEGLTVTYMPRGLGVGNADTLQQRARWFGYKAGYLGYCRVYLSSTGEHAYRKYLEHEESVRESLRRHSQSGKPLSEWKRAFILDSAFRPTRRTILQLDHQRYRFGGKWEWTKAPHDVKTAVEGNREVFASFIHDLEWKESDGHPDRRPQHRHLFAEEVPLRRALEHLFLPLRIPSATDSPLFTALQIHLEEHAAEHPDATCTIYRMSPTDLRNRGTNAKNGEISELFAGGYPYKGKNKESIYPGDRKIRANQGISIQLHRLDVYDGKVTDGKLLQEDVPVVAVWVPREMGQQWLVQNPTQDADD